MARTPKNKLLVKIPEAYRDDFVRCLDRATPMGQEMQRRYEKVLSDHGGEDALSEVKRSTVEDWAGLAVLVKMLWTMLGAGEQVDIGALSQLLNVKLGTSRAIGFERQARPVRSLREVMAGSAG